MEKVLRKEGTRRNTINDLFEAVINTFIIAFSLVGIWAFSCLIGGMLVSVGKLIMPLFSV